METKICKRCQQELSVDKFGKDKKSADRLAYKCKSCRTAEAKDNRARLAEINSKKSYREIYNLKPKHCKRCATDKPRNDNNWVRANGMLDGLQVYCRSCTSEIQKNLPKYIWTEKDNIKRRAKRRHQKRISNIEKAASKNNFAVTYSPETDEIKVLKVRFEPLPADSTHTSKGRVDIIKAYIDEEEAEEVANVLRNRTAETTDRQDLIPLFVKLNKLKLEK